MRFETVSKVQDIHGDIGLWGTAPAGDAVVFAFTKNEDVRDTELSPKLYIAWADANGQYELLEDSKIFNLPAGNYSVSAITYNAAHKTKSVDSQTFALTLGSSFLETLFYSLDTILNILALIAIAIGILITILVT